MHAREQKHLQHLLATFNASALGEGDPNTGANTLAAMLVTLASLAKFVHLHVDRDARAPARDRASIWWAAAPR
jgi:hypothetical protein